MARWGWLVEGKVSTLTDALELQRKSAAKLHDSHEVTAAALAELHIKHSDLSNELRDAKRQLRALENKLFDKGEGDVLAPSHVTVCDVERCVVNSRGVRRESSGLLAEMHEQMAKIFSIFIVEGDQAEAIQAAKEMAALAIRLVEEGDPTLKLGARWGEE